MSDASALKRSPLHEAHIAAGARMVPFAGWEMPVQYKGIVDEHRAVREHVGIFDISHMGQFLVEGSGVDAFLNRLLTNNVERLAPGEGQYTLLLNEQGGVIDDLIAYRLSENEFFLVVNASKIEEDFAWLKAHVNEDNVRLMDISAQTGGLAIQGPASKAVFHAVFGESAPYPARNRVFVSLSGEGILYLCGTGYTGEDGFEFFAPATEITGWHEKLVAAAHAHGGMACGLGARDTLRLEMGYPLNGNDLAPNKTPLEAGLGFFVDLEKESFIGRDALLRQKETGLPSRLAAFRMTGASPPPRAHYAIYSSDQAVGEIASGGLSPSLGYGIGMAYLPPALAKPGQTLEIEIRGKRYPAETVKKPFYRRPV